METLRTLIPRGRYGIDFRRSAETFGSIYVERDRQWLMTIYEGDVAAGHSEIEMAMAVPRLAEFPERRSATLRWLEAQKLALGAGDGRIRGQTEVEAFRIGMSFEQAQQAFLPALRENLNPLKVPAWPLAGTAGLVGPISAVVEVPTAPTAPQASTQFIAHSLPFACSVEQMLRNAKNACAASGREVIEVLKQKQFKFPDDESFRCHVVALLEAQEGRCKISGLPLQDPAGEGTDPQLFPSLDRIDSNGHYEPGNLQIVCRFINRWKSDERDSEFQRLVAMLRLPAE
jgi:hypothetical protein